VGALAAIALAVALFAFTQGQETRDAEAALGTTRGCSYVPDSGPWFNFTAACNSHDSCYVHHWRDKVGCDWKFLSDMNNYCYSTYQWWQWQRKPCLDTAWTYYLGVNTVGWGCYARWIAC
jgi:hypothetical protein